jgi:hypothetical protein
MRVKRGKAIGEKSEGANAKAGQNDARKQSSFTNHEGEAKAKGQRQEARRQEDKRRARTGRK